MRLYLKDHERRPDPAPVETDDRRAIVAGLVLWIAALVVALVVTSPASADSAVLWTCATGIALGVIGLLYTQFRRR